MKPDINNYLNADIGFLIDECVHDERLRGILKDKWINGWSYKRLADKYHLGERHIERIIDNQGDRLLLKIYPILKAQGKFKYDLTEPSQ